MNNELYHHGIQGQKWGIRRYQNEDGTLTAEGKARYYGDYTKTEKGKYKLSDVRKIRRGINKQAKAFSKQTKKGDKLRQYDPEYYRKMADMLEKTQKKYGKIALKQVSSQQRRLDVGKQIATAAISASVGSSIVNIASAASYSTGLGAGLDISSELLK